ncbi:hypothetical protein PS934_01670 [Pseudomonas fluorescens]|uniref:hypothetical protein n=1 Tax=Pseudomonas fluorescens TaxID=294 RepID=UPI00124010A2|nr:hypothetical protein [Pseudomonas fluorescens]VVP91769.1 hypothetical protein PS934_01670 [Pseudomonas fluorescens]
MRWWLCGLLLLVSADVRAGEVFLIPENNPKPVYPVALHRAGVTGMVRVSMTVQVDGSVSKAGILEGRCYDKKARQRGRAFIADRDSANLHHHFPDRFTLAKIIDGLG